VISRRDLMLAGMAVGAFGLASALEPRKRLLLLKGTTFEKGLPDRFGDWQAQPTNGLVGPEQAGRLARALYSEIVMRVYGNEVTDAEVMLLATYGDTQSDLLQLHRPESCYPAVGFTLSMARSVNLALPGGGVIPARRVVAVNAERTESIVYWARMGEALPQTGGEQRMVRLTNAAKGYIPDGSLIRCSALGEPDRAFPLLDRFIVEMLEATPALLRPALVGTELARRIA
jgi:EpsI family protein